MKTIQVHLYTYWELDKQAQQQAREHFSEIHTGDHWWDTDYDDFVNICHTIGIHTTPQQINFSGFWSQGDGSTFAASVDILPFIQGIAAQAWKAYAPALETDIPPCPCDTRLVRLIEREIVTVNLKTVKPRRGYWLEVQFDISYGDTIRPHPRIEAAAGELEQWASRTLEQLNRFLYTRLQETYEYLAGDEAIAAALTANGYLFTADGTAADWLLALPIEQP
ncbi:MAG: hypothetical protein ACO1NW_11675 [Chitinophagaceae bacterium]